MVAMSFVLFFRSLVLYRWRGERDVVEDLGLSTDGGDAGGGAGPMGFLTPVVS